MHDYIEASGWHGFKEERSVRGNSPVTHPVVNMRIFFHQRIHIGVIIPRRILLWADADYSSVFDRSR